MNIKKAMEKAENDIYIGALLRRHWFIHGPKLLEALKDSRSLVIDHHNISKPVKWGQLCPHCTKDNESVLNKVAKAITEASEVEGI